MKSIDRFTGVFALIAAVGLLLIGAEARGQEEIDESDLLWSRSRDYGGVCISNDGTKVVLSNDNGIYRIIDSDNGELIIELQLQIQRGTPIFSYDDSILIIVGAKGKLLTLNANTWEEIHFDDRFYDDDIHQWVSSVSITSDMRHFGFTSYVQGLIIIDLNDYSIFRQTEFPETWGRGDLTFSHDNTMYAVSNDNVTFIYDFETGEEITKVRGRDPKFSPTKDEIFVLGYETNKGFEPLYYDLSNIGEVDIFTEGFNYWRGNKHTDIGFDISRDGQYAVIVSGRYSAVQFFNIENNFSEDYKFIIKDPYRWLDDIKISESNRLICSDDYFLFCIDPDFTTPVEELEIEPEPELFVNIQDDILYVSLSESIGIAEPFALFTIDGRYIDMYMPESTDPTIPTAIDISNLSSGSYILSYKSDSILLSKTFNIIK